MYNLTAHCGFCLGFFLTFLAKLFTMVFILSPIINKGFIMHSDPVQSPPKLKIPSDKKRPIVGVGVTVFRPHPEKNNGDNNGGHLQILMLQRPDGVWTIPGGKQELWESYHDCGRREILEETGIEVTLCPDYCAVSDLITPPIHYVLLTLTGWADSHTITVEKSPDIADVQWLDVDDALALPLWHRTTEVILESRDHLLGKM